MLEAFDRACQIDTLKVDAKQFIVHPSIQFPDGADTQVPAMLVYLLNMLAKAAIAAMPAAAMTTAYNSVDPIGVILCYVFSLARFRVCGHSFGDILVAKYHKVCPVLFGISGDQKTNEGRKRLGWLREDGEWAPSQKHFDKVNGICIGWAAITLRDFSRSKEQNAFPPNPFYWRAMACIVNTPAIGITETHSVALRGLIDRYAKSFVKFFGAQGIIALRNAVVTYTSKAPPSSAADAVRVLGDSILQKHGIGI
jgi:nucleoporin GLE1